MPKPKLGSTRQPWAVSEARVLRALAGPGPHTGSRLAETLRYPRAKVSIAIHGLECAGLAVRELDPAHAQKRRCFYSLTPAGRERVAALKEQSHE